MVCKVAFLATIQTRMTGVLLIMRSYKSGRIIKSPAFAAGLAL
jgi:hypothetical protein